MTAHFSYQNHGEDGEITSTVLRKVASPEEFAAACRQIVTLHGGHAAHRMLDRLVTELLCSLGYSEGMAVFIAHVAPFHPSPADARPRIGTPESASVPNRAGLSGLVSTHAHGSAI